MISLEEYESIRRKVETAEREQAKAAGALQELLRQLKAEFDCDSVREAELLLKEEEKRQASLEKKLHREIEQFKKDWLGVINNE